MGKYMVIRLGPNGEREVEAFGFRGDGNSVQSDCRRATAFMEEALGKTSDVRAKTEWEIRNGDQARKTEREFGINVRNHCG